MKISEPGKMIFSVSEKDPFIELKDTRAFLRLHDHDFIIMHLP